MAKKCHACRFHPSGTRLKNRVLSSVQVDVYTAESIPAVAKDEIDRMLGSGDLFGYTSATDSPVALLETEFAEYMGSKYALAVSSCSASHDTSATSA